MTDLTILSPAEIDQAWLTAATPGNGLRHQRNELFKTADKYRRAGGKYIERADEYKQRADDLIAKITEADKACAPFEIEWKRRGGWSRAYIVPGGHIHKSTHCQSLYPTTIISWLPEQSGWDEEKIVEAAGMMACTFCYPSAPVDALRAAFEASKMEGLCPGTGTWDHDSSGMRYASPRARCTHCGQTTSVTSTGKLRRHKPKNAVAA